MVIPDNVLESLCLPGPQYDLCQVEVKPCWTFKPSMKAGTAGLMAPLTNTCRLDFLKAKNRWWKCSECRVRQLSNSFLQIPFVFLKAFLFCCGHLLWMNCCWMNCFWMNCCWMNCVWMNCPSSPDSDPDPDPDPDPDTEVPYRAVRVLCWDNF